MVTTSRDYRRYTRRAGGAPPWREAVEGRRHGAGGPAALSATLAMPWRSGCRGSGSTRPDSRCSRPRDSLRLGPGRGRPGRRNIRGGGRRFRTEAYPGQECGGSGPYPRAGPSGVEGCPGRGSAAQDGGLSGARVRRTGAVSEGEVRPGLRPVRGGGRRSKTEGSPGRGAAGRGHARARDPCRAEDHSGRGCDSPGRAVRGGVRRTGEGSGAGRRLPALGVGHFPAPDEPPGR